LGVGSATQRTCGTDVVPRESWKKKGVWQQMWPATKSTLVFADPILVVFEAIGLWISFLYLIKFGLCEE